MNIGNLNKIAVSQNRQDELRGRSGKFAAREAEADRQYPQHGAEIPG